MNSCETRTLREYEPGYVSGYAKAAAPTLHLDNGVCMFLVYRQRARGRLEEWITVGDDLQTMLSETWRFWVDAADVRAMLGERIWEHLVVNAQARMEKAQNKERDHRRKHACLLRWLTAVDCGQSTVMRRQVQRGMLSRAVKSGLVSVHDANTRTDSLLVEVTDAGREWLRRETLPQRIEAFLARKAREATGSQQDLSGIHAPGGCAEPTEPVSFAIDKPGAIGQPPTEVQQRWTASVAARDDDRMPDETDMVFVCPDCGYTAPRDLNAACNLQQAAEEYRRLKTRAEDETEVGAAGPVV
jgi:predicted RNA-binding Zn-ribbon protein involved in translation (DUF1610 family)